MEREANGMRSLLETTRGDKTIKSSQMEDFRSTLRRLYLGYESVFYGVEPHTILDAYYALGRSIPYLLIETKLIGIGGNLYPSMRVCEFFKTIPYPLGASG